MEVKLPYFKFRKIISFIRSGSRTAVWTRIFFSSLNCALLIPLRACASSPRSFPSTQYTYEALRISVEKASPLHSKCEMIAHVAHSNSWLPDGVRKLFLFYRTPIVAKHADQQERQTYDAPNTERSQQN